jgi:hypothetical protein
MGKALRVKKEREEGLRLIREQKQQKWDMGVKGGEKSLTPFYRKKINTSRGGKVYTNLVVSTKRYNVPTPIVSFKEKNGKLILFPIGE